MRFTLRHFKASLMLAAAVPVIVTGSVHAADFTQQDVFRAQSYGFDLKGECNGGGDATSTAKSTYTNAQQIASTFILGITATTPPQVVKDLAKEYKIGGMYVLDTQDAAKAGFDKAFYDSLNTLAGHKLVIASDEEGEPVHRYAYTTSFPSAADLASKPNDEITNVVKNASATMAQNGLNADLAPVLDLRTVGAAGRSFSSDPNVVADKAGAWTAGLVANGVKPIFKHFPGFDSTTSGNTDTEKVVMTGSIDEVIKPYDVLLKKYSTGGVMLSNLYVNKLDENYPASLSTGAVNYLRDTMKFGGLITTDDIGVSSVTDKAGSLGDAVSAALQAGVTMPLFTLKNTGSTADAKNEIDQIVAKVQANSAAMTNAGKSASIIKSFTGDSGTSTTTQQTSGGGCCSASGGSGSAIINGSDNPEIVWNYFKGRGLDNLHIAAVMGNIQQESGFMPQRIQGSGVQLSPDPASAGGGGWGMAQWTPGSKIFATRDFLKTAMKPDKTPVVNELPNLDGPIDAIATQLDIIWGEMNTRTPTYYQTFMPDFLPINDLGQATVFYQTNYEGPNPSEAGPRTQMAQAWLDQYGGGTPGGGTSTPSSGGGCAQQINQGLSPDCQAAQGSAKILCAAKPYDGISYVWGGGHSGSAQSWLDGCKTIDASCGLDCSGMVNIAVWLAFGVDLQETTAGERDDDKNWKEVSRAEAQPGDIIQPHSGHVEIIDHFEGDTVHTFGAHQSGVPQPDQVGPTSFPYTDGMLIMHFTGANSQV